MPSVENMTTTASATGADTGSSAGVGRGVLRQLAVDSGYVLLGFPLALVSFIVLIVGVALSAGLMVTVTGLPILAGTLYAARSFADIERLRMPAVLRQPRVRPSYRTVEPGASAWRRIFVPISDGQSWLDLAHGILRLIVAVGTFAITVSWWAGAVGGSLYWAYDWTIPSGPNDEGLHELLGLGDTDLARIGLNTALGVFFLITLPVVVRG